MTEGRFPQPVRLECPGVYLLRFLLIPMTLLLTLAPFASGQETGGALPGDATGDEGNHPPARYVIEAIPDAIEGDTIELYKVRFRFAPEIRPSRVFLRGSFNNWNPIGDLMKGPDSGGAFELVQYVPPGFHDYLYVVDGVSVVHDGPPADTASTSPSGGDGFPGFVADNRFERVVLKKGDGTIFAEGLGLGPGATSVTRISLTTIDVATRVNRDDVDSASILFHSGGAEKRFPLRKSGKDDLFAYYRGEFPLGIAEEGWLGIQLYDGDSSRVITTTGLEESALLSRLLPVGPMHTPLVEVPEWVSSGIHYHLVPDIFCNGNRSNDPKRKKDRYGGDLEGVLEKLSWIADLGITAISFTPLHDSPSALRYDAGNFREVGSGIGGNEAFRLVVEEAHRLDIRLIVTLTLHSTSNEHYAFVDAIQKGGASEYSTWYEWNQWPIPKEFSQGDQPSDYYACFDLDGKVPSLNFDMAHPRAEEITIEKMRDAEVNESLLTEIDSTLDFWLTEMGVDGLVIDRPDQLPPWLNRHIREYAVRLQPDIYLASEGDGDQRETQYSSIFPLFDMMNGYLSGFETAGSFAEKIESNRGIRPSNLLRASTGLLFREGETPPDSQWNRKGFLVGYTHLLTSPGFPRIHGGDEIGFASGYAEGGDGAYPWDDLLEPSRLAIRDQLRRLIAIRQEHPALSGGEEKIILAEDHLLARACWKMDDALLVVLNAGEEPAEIEVLRSALPFEGGAPIELLTGQPVTTGGENDERFSLRIEGQSSAILHFPLED